MLGLDITRQHEDINHQKAYRLYKIVLSISNLLSDLMHSQPVQCQHPGSSFRICHLSSIDNEKSLNFILGYYTQRYSLWARRENAKNPNFSVLVSTIYTFVFKSAPATSFTLKVNWTFCKHHIIIIELMNSKPLFITMKCFHLQLHI